MSDAESGDEGQKEDGGKSKTLSLKRTVESGQVRQSFSHGRSKSVLVEKRRKRIVKPGQEATDSDMAEAPTAAAPQDTAPQMPDGLSKAEQEKRLAAVQEAKTRAVEEAKQAEIDAKRRAEDDARRAEERAQREAEEARRAEEKSRKAKAKPASEEAPTGDRSAKPASRRAPEDDKRRQEEKNARLPKSAAVSAVVAPAS